jgi:hypothetical protein
MLLADGPALRLRQHPGERTGLSKPARHRRIASQQVSDFSAGQPPENAVPFLKNQPNRLAIPSHPAPEVLAGDLKPLAMPAEFGGDPAILGRVDSVNEPMR